MTTFVRMKRLPRRLFAGTAATRVRAPLAASTMPVHLSGVPRSTPRIIPTARVIAGPATMNICAVASVADLFAGGQALDREEHERGAAHAGEDERGAAQLTKRDLAGDREGREE